MFSFRGKKRSATVPYSKGNVIVEQLTDRLSKHIKASGSKNKFN